MKTEIMKIVMQTFTESGEAKTKSTSTLKLSANYIIENHPFFLCLIPFLPRLFRKLSRSIATCLLEHGTAFLPLYYVKFFFFFLISVFVSPS